MHIISTHTDSATVYLLHDLLLLFFVMQNVTSLNLTMSNFMALLWNLEFARSYCWCYWWQKIKTYVLQKRDHLFWGIKCIVSGKQIWHFVNKSLEWWTCRYDAHFYFVQTIVGIFGFRLFFLSTAVKLFHPRVILHGPISCISRSMRKFDRMQLIFYFGPQAILRSTWVRLERELAFLAYCARFTSPPKRLPVSQPRIILMFGYIMAIDSTEQRQTLILFYISRAVRFVLTILACSGRSFGAVSVASY